MADPRFNFGKGGSGWSSPRPVGFAPAQDLFGRAKAAYQAGNLGLAEQLCQQLLTSRPDDTGALSLLGLVAGMSNRPELGIELLRRVLAIDPNSWASLNALSIMLRLRGDFGEAIEVRLKALELRPGDPNSINELGLCYLDLRDLRVAGETFQRAIALQSNVASFHHNLARVRQLEGRIAESIESFRRAVTIDPRSAVSYSSLGKMFLQLGKDVEAVECFKRAYEVDPNSVRGNLDMANAFIEQDRFDEAEPYITTALNIDGNSPDANGLMGTWLQQQGKFSEAETHFLAALEARPLWAAPYVLIVTGRKMTEEDRPFIGRLSSVVSNPSLTKEEVGEMHYALGKAFDDLKEYSTAIHHYDEANRLAAKRISKIMPFSKEAYVEGTTRTMDTFTSDFFLRHRNLGSESDLPVLIVGMMRSGTTLTDQILTSHPEISGAGELTFWMEEGRELHQNLRDSLTAEEIDPIVERYLQTLTTRAPGSKRVTDKMPQNYMALGLIHTSFPNARIIHCRRNPVDNCLSIYFTHLRTSPDFGHVRENIVAMYQQYLRVMEHWRAVLPPDRFMEIDYEDMVADRESIVRRMIDFVGLEWDDACLHHDENDRTVRTPSLWQARQPVYKTSVERWRNYEPYLGAFRDLLPKS
jgi:tetratricopeptide (TPR) repeat protein